MNKVNAYCILDTKAKVYNSPYFLINDQVAVRQFQLVIKDPESMISKYPEDYRLYKTGTFDMLTGKIESLDVPLEIAHGLTFKNEV